MSCDGHGPCQKGSVLGPVIAFIRSSSKKSITLDWVMAKADRPRRPVLRVLDRLTREGYLQEVADEPIANGVGESGPPRRNPTWRVITTPPMPTLSPKRRTIRDRIWQAIRMKRRFTLKDIMFITGQDEGSVRLYVRMLVKSGHLRVVGKIGTANIYFLLPSKDCGPQRPSAREVNHV